MLLRKLPSILKTSGFVIECPDFVDAVNIKRKITCTIEPNAVLSKGLFSIILLSVQFCDPHLLDRSHYLTGGTFASKSKC